jgi:peptidylprolyl isomerase
MSDQLDTADPPVVKGPRHGIPKPPRDNRPAILGAVAGVAVVGVLIAVFLSLRGSGAGAGSPQPATGGAATAAAAAPTPTTAAAAAPTPTTGPLAVKPVVTAGNGRLNRLVITPIVAGTGGVVRSGQTVTVNYVLVGYATGKQIEASWDSGGPVPMVVGVGRLIKGWDEGLPGQKVGSRIRLDVPAALAYGPEKGDLRFVVDILSAT